MTYVDNAPFSSETHLYAARNTFYRDKMNTLLSPDKTRLSAPDCLAIGRLKRLAELHGAKRVFFYGQTA